MLSKLELQISINKKLCFCIFDIFKMLQDQLLKNFVLHFKTFSYKRKTVIMLNLKKKVDIEMFINSSK